MQWLSMQVRVIKLIKLCVSI